MNATSQRPNRIQRFAETLYETFWHLVKSNKSQPNPRLTQQRVEREPFRHTPAARRAQTSFQPDFRGPDVLDRLVPRAWSLQTGKSACTICSNTVMIPFRLTFEPGIPVHEQATFAAKKAMMSGQLRPGDPFPSVRALSKALKINPNTAHKVITQLTLDGLLEVRPGIGTVVTRRPVSSRADRRRLLGREVEQLTVEAKKLGLRLEEVQESVAEHWSQLDYKEAKEEA